MSDKILISPEDCENFKLAKSGTPLTEIFPHGIVFEDLGGTVSARSAESVNFDVLKLEPVFDYEPDAMDVERLAQKNREVVERVVASSNHKPNPKIMELVKSFSIKPFLEQNKEVVFRVLDGMEDDLVLLDADYIKNVEDIFKL